MIQTIKTATNIIRTEGLKSLFKKSFTYLKQLSSMPFYLIKCKYKKQMTIEKSLDIAYNSIAGILTPAQVKSEIQSLLYILFNMQPKRLMEIGTGKG